MSDGLHCPYCGRDNAAKPTVCVCERFKHQPAPAVPSGEENLSRTVVRILISTTGGAAVNAVREDYPDLAEAVDKFAAHLIQQERERCARIAEGVMREEQNIEYLDISSVQYDAQLTGIGAARKIAAAIRSGE